MKFGRLLDQRRAKSGQGLRLTGIPEKLPEHMPGAGTRKARQDFGIRFLNHAEKMLHFILASSRHIKKFFLGGGIFCREESGKKSHVERFNLTLRQRMPRLARKTPSFSKNMKNHIGALWNFIHHHNENIAPNLVTTFEDYPILGSPQGVVMLLSSTLEISSCPCYFSVKNKVLSERTNMPPVRRYGGEKAIKHGSIAMENQNLIARNVFASLLKIHQTK